jgi:large subunit ribosomal protein L22
MATQPTRKQRGRRKMGKAARPRILSDNKARAIGRMMRTSPRKLNLVAQAIRGKTAEQALNELTFSRKRIAVQLKRVLQSAIANAENNHDLDVDDLVVAEASVGKNMVLKRFHARARGRGARIEKPFSQVTIIVEERRKEKEKKTAKKPARKPARRPAAKKPKVSAKEKA